MKNSNNSSGKADAQLNASTDVTRSEAKATSISDAIECAEWSIAQNRGTDFVKEAE